MLHLNQWGFKKGISTELLLLYLTETWKKAIDSGYKIGVIFVDFKKAFDTVDHQVLKYKLQAVGIAGDLHEWIVDYLSDRKQYIEIWSKIFHTNSQNQCPPRVALGTEVIRSLRK